MFVYLRDHLDEISPEQLQRSHFMVSLENKPEYVFGFNFPQPLQDLIQTQAQFHPFKLPPWLKYEIISECYVDQVYLAEFTIYYLNY